MKELNRFQNARSKGAISQLVRQQQCSTSFFDSIIGLERITRKGVLWFLSLRSFVFLIPTMHGGGVLCFLWFGLFEIQSIYDVFWRLLAKEREACLVFLRHDSPFHVQFS